MLTGASEIEADITFGLTVDITCRDTDLCLLEEFCAKLYTLQAERAAIDPSKVGALKTHSLDGRELRRKLSNKVIVVTLDVEAELREPILALIIGSLESLDTKGIDIASLIDIDGTVYCSAELRIGSYDIGDLEAGDIEALGAGSRLDAVVAVLVTKACVGSVGVARHCDTIVDLVGNNRNAMAEADVAHAAEFFGSPDTACWVVGVAEEENLGVGQSRLGLEVLPINLIAILGADKLILHEVAMAIIDAGEEAVVCRGLHKDATTIALKALDDGGHSGYYANGVDNPIGLDMPIVATCVPIGYGIIEALGDLGVAVDVVVDATLEGLNNLGGYGKIHVGDPERDDVLFGGVDVPLITVGSATIGGRVEIERHFLSVNS